MNAKPAGASWNLREALNVQKKDALRNVRILQNVDNFG
jgi:hypothetical protein